MVAREWAREIGHDPTRVEDDGFLFMHVMQQKASLAESGDGALHSLLIEVATACALKPFHDARFVAFGLQPADKPGAGIRKTLVVEVDRVLRREHQAKAVGARLLQQSKEQPLRRWVRHRRHVAEQFIHVQNRAQTGCALLRPHPRDEFV